MLLIIRAKNSPIGPIEATAFTNAVSLPLGKTCLKPALVAVVKYE